MILMQKFRENLENNIPNTNKFFEFTDRRGNRLTNTQFSCIVNSAGRRWGGTPTRTRNNTAKAATRKSITNTLTRKDLWEQWIKQDGRCAYTGIPLVMRNMNPKLEQNASLDRIDNDKNYVKGNIVWCHKVVNIMKHVLPLDEFIQWCKMIADNFKNDRIINKNMLLKKVESYATK